MKLSAGDRLVLHYTDDYNQEEDGKGTEATPSGWRPGKLTLKPGPELVGRVWEVWKVSMERE